MSRILVISRTNLPNNYVNVIAIDRDRRRILRLFDATGRREAKYDCPYLPRDVWDIEYNDGESDLPHSEDICVRNRTKVSTLKENLSVRDVLKRLNFTIYTGNIREAYANMLRGSKAGSYYTTRTNPPAYSVVFWINDKSLSRKDFEGKVRYRYEDKSHDKWGFTIPYVGSTMPIDFIPMKSLVQLSLSDWWTPSPTKKERCYLQVVAWHDLQPPDSFKTGIPFVVVNG